MSLDKKSGIYLICFLQKRFNGGFSSLSSVTLFCSLGHLCVLSVFSSFLIFLSLCLCSTWSWTTMWVVTCWLFSVSLKTGCQRRWPNSTWLRWCWPSTLFTSYTTSTGEAHTGCAWAVLWVCNYFQRETDWAISPDDGCSAYLHYSCCVGNFPAVGSLCSQMKINERVECVCGQVCLQSSPESFNSSA